LGIGLQRYRLNGWFCAATIAAVARDPQVKKPASCKKVVETEALDVGAGPDKTVHFARTPLRNPQDSMSWTRKVPDREAVSSGLADAVVATAPA
jgi:hypothetical protein